MSAKQSAMMWGILIGIAAMYAYHKYLPGKPAA